MVEKGDSTSFCTIFSFSQQGFAPVRVKRYPQSSSASLHSASCRLGDSPPLSLCVLLVPFHCTVLAAPVTLSPPFSFGRFTAKGGLLFSSFLAGGQKGNGTLIVALPLNNPNHEVL